MALLTITPGTHPNTYRVLHIASLIGSFGALYFKNRYPRPRPSHVCPALLPPIPVPGHPAFPSGHATQAHLMARCIRKVLEPPAPVAVDHVVYARTLRALARRVARNREIAGLHYPSDSEGGRVLADALFAEMDVAAMAVFQQTVTDAKVEWP
jgi:membrane-associated phospholipid phosphatase